MIDPSGGGPYYATLADRLALLSKPHRIVTKAEIRSESQADNSWENIPVVDGEIIFNEQRQPATLRLVTVAEQVLGRTSDGDPTVMIQAPDIAPWGSWIRVRQLVSVPGIEDDPLVYPLGYFRVETVETNRDTVVVYGSDALSVLESDDVPLGLQRLLRAQSKRDRVTNLIQQAWPPLTDAFASPLFDDSGMPTGTVPATQDAQWDVDRITLIQAILSPLKLHLLADREGNAVYRVANLIDPGADPKPVVDIAADNPHQAGLIDVDVRKSRVGVLNRVVVGWTETTKLATRQQQTLVDLKGTVADDSPIHQGQRFGVQSEFVQASDVKNATEAVARGKQRITERLWEATQIQVTCTPVHGLEVGDCVALRDRTDNIGVGWVERITVPLGSASAAWRLSVQPANLIDSPLGRRNTSAATYTRETQFKKWRTLNAAAVDETCKTLKGWLAVSGCTMSADSKTEITVTCTAATGKFRTTGAYTSVSQPRVMRASLSIGKVDKNTVSNAFTARLLFDGVPGKWVTIAKGKSGTIATDEIALTASGAQSVEIEFKNANVGQKIHVAELRVEVPALK
jgi:hypothetical protein